MKRIVAVIVLSMLPLVAAELPNWEFSGGKVGPWKHTFRLSAAPTAE